jgi:transposase-like protein
MLKDPVISRYTAQRTHRTYAPEFKAGLVAACQVPGASIAALARQHGMNANVLHRWLKEHQRSGCHALAARSAPGGATPSPTFIPLTLPAPTPAAREQEIKVELRKGVLSLVVTWPASAVAEFASWTAAILK